MLLFYDCFFLIIQNFDYLSFSLFFLSLSPHTFPLKHKRAPLFAATNIKIPEFVQGCKGSFPTHRPVLCNDRRPHHFWFVSQLEYTSFLSVIINLITSSDSNRKCGGQVWVAARRIIYIYEYIISSM